MSLIFAGVIMLVLLAPILRVVAAVWFESKRSDDEKELSE